MKRRVKKLLAALAALIFALLLILVPAPALLGARHGLTLCSNTVIPSLFPFLVVSAFIIGAGFAKSIGRFFGGFMQKVFRLDGSAAAALILGAIGGYPVGASAVSELVKNGCITKKEAEKLLCFAINSSPAFIIGAVGAGFLKNSFAGILLYTAHLLASLTIGLLMRGRKKGETGKTRKIKSVSKFHTAESGISMTGAFVGAVISSAKSIIIICAFVVLFSAVNELFAQTGIFSVFSGFLSNFLPVPQGDSYFFSRVATGILEVTNGCFAAAGSGGMNAVLLCAGILGFSGLSVQFQVISLVRETGISTKAFILTRFLHAAISVLFAFILFSFFPNAVPSIPCVSTMLVSVGTVTASVHRVPAVFAMLILTALLLLSVATV